MTVMGIKGAKIISTISTSFSDFFANAVLLITNAQEHPDIAAGLDALGYDAATLEVEINRLVYQLYGLTTEEIAIVEGK